MKKILGIIAIIVLLSSCAIKPSQYAGSCPPPSDFYPKIDTVIPFFQNEKLEKIHIKLNFVFFYNEKSVDKIHFETEALNQMIESVNKTNELFGNRLIFETTEIYQFIPDYTKDIQTWLEKTRDWTEDFEKGNGAITVFVTATHNDLNGFTPIFESHFDYYERFSPTYDNIYLSYRSLKRNTTLAHELGHFFSLPHTWEYKDEDIEQSLGLNDNTKCINIMSYNCYRDEFTEPQIDQMIQFILKWRAYLIN